MYERYRVCDHIGIVPEVKKFEGRVGMAPTEVEGLTDMRKIPLIGFGAGLGSGFSDDLYRASRAILTSVADVWQSSNLLVHVKEPQPSEYAFLRPNLALFTYLHLAADRDLTVALMRSKCLAIGYETVRTDDGAFPLLAPMSDVAGRLAMIQAAHHLQSPYGGRGVLVCGAEGIPAANVLVVGAGRVGSNAMEMALGMGARVSVLDSRPEKLRAIKESYGDRIAVEVSTTENIEDLLPQMDAVVLAPYVDGAESPKLITRAMLKTMRRGAVVVDVSIDQGGSTEVSQPTTHEHPWFEVDGVIVCCVANLPGAVARTSTAILSKATAPYVKEMATYGVRGAIARDTALAHGVQVVNGHLVNEAVAEKFGLPYTPFSLDLLDAG